MADDRQRERELERTIKDLEDTQSANEKLIKSLLQVMGLPSLWEDPERQQGFFSVLIPYINAIMLAVILILLLIKK